MVAQGIQYWPSKGSTATLASTDSIEPFNERAAFEIQDKFGFRTSGSIRLGDQLSSSAGRKKKAALSKHGLRSSSRSKASLEEENKRHANPT
jgi:hypothetical protein